MYCLGIDLGSTTIKYVLLDEKGQTLARDYLRHQSAVVETLRGMLSELERRVDLCGQKLRVVFSGSGALGVAQQVQGAFVQEVVAASVFLKNRAPGLDAAVELGGEDAKLLYLSNGVELRMNEACAGGTGAFIDQMASLLDTDAAGLDQLALSASVSHPIASRCGVFAKTDVVALFNNGVPKSEVARSVFDAVVEQTVSGLACGRALKGRIAFLGGPLSFLKGLRQAFERKLQAPGTEFVQFEDAHFAVAWGAARQGFDETSQEIAGSRLWQGVGELQKILKDIKLAVANEIELVPLFDNEEQKQAFLKRHAAHKAPRGDLAQAEGDLFLGIDLGSTTIKGVVLDGNGRIVSSWYDQNEGNPLEKLFERMRSLLQSIPQKACLRAAATTGYGADLARAAVGAQFSEVETLAHQRAAVAFDPQTSYVIDIGGQDMKCLDVREGLIRSVKLNEACSSGCGSFLQTFARQLDLSLEEFVEAAMRSRHPCDLGTRCTVFMNSKVRQAQRDAAPIEDIAAGLCRSIVRNALYKVLRIHDVSELGSHVLVQGGTFLNDAVLRAFEQQTGLEVIRPDISGLMGAYGAALIARERTAADTPALGLIEADLDASRVKVREFRCKGCTNHCQLKMNRFPSGQKFFSGNRCDFAMKSGGLKGKQDSGFVAWKMRLLFGDDEPLPTLATIAAAAPVVGIPRVLNMYEHFPYWKALFTALGMRVVLSPPSEHGIGQLGSDTIPSQTLCFPAKLAHGHLAQLVHAGVRDVWLPCVPREGVPFKESDARFACPVVGGYPEALKLNTEEAYPGVRLLTPFLDLNNDKTVERALLESFPDLQLRDVRRAVKAGRQALEIYRQRLRAKGEEIWRRHAASSRPLIVLAGHPYHIDPLINHGIPALIESMGADLVTEDAVAHLARMPEHLEVVNQWTFHSRLYRAAQLVKDSDCAELVQLVSFGCGLDAITSEQIKRQLESAGKIYTMLKIDEGDTLGAARIRLRSLLAAVEDRRLRKKGLAPAADGSDDKQSCGALAAKRRKIYAPQMAPLHFPILAGALKSLGWDVEVLPEVSAKAIELGLAHVNNDACYPAIVVIGQLLEAATSPGFDPQTSALLLAQTCGPCRATNYPGLLKWALKDVGMGDLPVVCLSAASMRGVEHLDLGLKGFHRLMLALLYGDLLQRLTLYVRTYETERGSTQELTRKWIARGIEVAGRGDAAAFAQDAKRMVKEFLAVDMTVQKKPRVGIVGEILLKYHPRANLEIVDEIINEGAEPVLGDITNFMLYCLNDNVYQARSFGGSKIKGSVSWLLIKHYERLRRPMLEAVRGTPVEGSMGLAQGLDDIRGFISEGQQAGEGWLLTAEMIDFIRTGTPNVVCLQPFGCLPNHITGKGVMRRLRSDYPQANLCAIDFEAGTSKSNVANRLKLFIAQAKENFAARKDASGDKAPRGPDAGSGRRTIKILQRRPDNEAQSVDGHRAAFAGLR